MRYAWLALVLGCSVPRGGLPMFDGSDAGVDSSTDAAIDAPGVDAPGVDAPGVDAPGMDAMTDGTVDAFDAFVVDSGCGTIGTRSCAGSMLQECTPAGLTDVRDCLRGCSAGTCDAYDVRNVDMDRLLHVGTAGLTITSGQTVTLDTNTGEVVLEPDTQLRPPGVGLMNGISYEREAQPSGAPGLAIFSVDTLQIDSGGTLRARGDDVPVILVGGDAIIAGVIDVSASGRIGGVGGYNGGTHGNDGGGGAARGDSGERSGGSLSGGGGGGHAANGGQGGDDGGATGGQGGMVIDDSGGTPLIGGGGGGGNATFFDDGRSGGGGGGAVQVSAGTALVVSGVVRASGAGGGAGYSSGAGGGAGGSIVLEAPRVDISGIVVANGGGGGGGQPLTLDEAQAGENGRDDGDRARGGDGPGGGKNGGDGGSSADLSGEGGQDGGPAGGGGGAAGRIAFYTEGGAPSVSGTVSPDPIMDAIP